MNRNYTIYILCILCFKYIHVYTIYILLLTGIYIFIYLDPALRIGATRANFNGTEKTTSLIEEFIKSDRIRAILSMKC